MSDLDKDIDRLKELQSTIYEGGDYIYLSKNDKQALGNVLTEFQGLREFSAETVRRNAELQEELETYKKIAEKLALTILEIDVEEKDVYETICKSTPNNRCEEFGNGNCTECIIDWARKEVKNE